MFDESKLVVTGGTGSIGNLVLNRFLDKDIQEIRILVEIRKSMKAFMRKVP